MAGRPKGTPKTGGRKPGARNKSASKGPLFVERVKRALAKKAKLSFEDLSVALLTCGVPAVIQKELQQLREYEMGKPLQPVAGDSEGGPIKIVFPY